MDNDGSYDVFLSYHWRDHAQVENLASTLCSLGLKVFLDRWYLHPGRPWPQELQAALAACRSVAVCVGPSDMGPWQQREANVALERQAREPFFPVIPVLLPGADPVLGFLAQNTWIDLRSAPSDLNLIQILAGAIRGQAPTPEARDRIKRTVSSVSPYRGLLYFREEDAPFFFGRDAAIEQLCEIVSRQSFVALVGASGSGKSSVVRAGLVPALRRNHERTWEIATMVPGDRPFHALAGALLPLLEPDMTETERLIEITKLAAAFETGNIELRDVVERVLAKETGTNRFLLVADQLEELYTLTTDETMRRRFIDGLLEASVRAPLSVVLTLRGDFVGHALRFRPLSDRLQGAQVNLGPMNRSELAFAVERPAEKVGLGFEAGLVERILDDAGDEPGNLPLLEFVLKQLWENRSHGQFFHEAYDGMGRLQGAVAQKAEAIFDALSGDEQRAAQRIFLQLATPAEDSDYTRRRASLAEMDAASTQVMQRLTDERLLVTSTAAGGGEETVEVSHEALIHNWKRLKTWLDQDREYLLWRKRFAEFMTPWRRNPTEETLLTGAFLVEAEKWLDERGGRLADDERKYITKSASHQAREATHRRDVARGVVVALIVFSLLIAWYAVDSQRQKSRAEAEASHSFALQLAAQSARMMSTRLADALLLGLAAVDQQENHETRSNLFRVIQFVPPKLRGFLLGHTDAVSALAFGRDGSVLASASWDHKAILWDVAKRRPIISPLVGHKDEIRGLVLSPDGSKLVTAGNDNSLLLWELNGPRSPLEPKRIGTAHQGPIHSIAISPDGETVAVGNSDHTVGLWDLNKGREFGRLRGHTADVHSLTFNPRDARILASSSADKTVMLWDISHQRTRGEPLNGHLDQVYGLAFAPDGKTLASGSLDRTVRLWDVSTRKLMATLQAQAGVLGVRYSPDGKTLAMSTQAQSVILWDVAKGTQFESLEVQGGEVFSVAFAPGGRWLVTGSWNKTVGLWDLSQRGPPMGHDDEVVCAAFSPDGRLLATGSSDGFVRLWDSGKQLLFKKLGGHTGGVNAVAFKADGKILASAGNDGKVRFWDMPGARLLGEPMEAQHGEIHSVAFSPDGQMLALGAADNTVSLWDPFNRTRIGDPLQGHRDRVYSVAFNHDGAILASGSKDRTVILWNIAKREILGKLEKHSGEVFSVAFHPKENILASGGLDRSVIRWDVETHKPLHEPIKAHRDAVASVAFSPDGNKMAIGSWDHTVSLWDARNPRQLGELPKRHTDLVWRVAFSAGGDKLASAGRDKTVVLWDVNLDVSDLKRRACALVNRNFSNAEWRAYMGERPYRKVCPNFPAPGDPGWPF